MPTEVRYIYFDFQEIGLALLELRRRCGRVVPEGEMFDPVLDQDAATKTIRFTMNVIGADGRRDRLVADQAELGTALIHFCRREKIPLPIRANKIVGMVDGKLALICTRGKKDYLPLEPLLPDTTVNVDRAPADP